MTELYVTRRLDDTEIGARFEVPAWRVTMRRRELDVHRPAGAPPGDTVRSWLQTELYLDREWSATEIAADLDTTVHLVLRTLHEHGIPVRRGGSPPKRAGAPPKPG